MVLRNHDYQPARNQRLCAESYTDERRVCFVTIRAYRGQSPFATDALNEMVLSALSSEADTHDCDVHTFCLMPDHLHFLTSPRVNGASPLVFVDRFKGRTTNQSWVLGWNGKLWQPRYYDHVVRREEDLAAIAKYILDNPVRRQLVVRREDWRWKGEFAPLPVYGWQSYVRGLW